MGDDHYNKEKCWISQKTRFTDTSGNSSNTVSFNLIGGYEGIPEVTLLNILAFLVMLRASEPECMLIWLAFRPWLLFSRS